MTNNEIRRDIERRIILQGGVTAVFNNLVEENAKAIIKQLLNVKNASKDSLYVANMAISFTIS